MPKKAKVAIGIVGGLVLLLLGVLVGSKVPPKEQITYGSVNRGGEYHATTTGGLTALEDNNFVTITTSTDYYSKYSGTLGSIILTSPRSIAGVLELYDATTTNILIRERDFGGKVIPTTSLLLASMPISAATGTYPYDVSFTRGLLLRIVGQVPTSTITWR